MTSGVASKPANRTTSAIRILIPERPFEGFRRDVTRVKIQPIFRMTLVSRVVFQEPRRRVVIFHPMIGQRKYCLRIDGVEVAILDPAVPDHDEVALPTRGRAVGRAEA